MAIQQFQQKNHNTLRNSAALPIHHHFCPEELDGETKTEICSNILQSSLSGATQISTNYTYPLNKIISFSHSVSPGGSCLEALDLLYLWMLSFPAKLDYCFDKHDRGKTRISKRGFAMVINQVLTRL
ncbi:hypothetical protein IC582_010349 [Cucumis melo]